MLNVQATVPRAEFAAFLMRDGLRRKRLATARGGRLTYRTPVSVPALRRRYDGIEIVARRLPIGRRTRSIRSLRVNTKTLVDRFARRRAG